MAFALIPERVQLSFIHMNTFMNVYAKFLWLREIGRYTQRHIYYPFRVLPLALMLPFICRQPACFFPGMYCYFHEYHSTHAVYICATNTQPSNQLKYNFLFHISRPLFAPFKILDGAFGWCATSGIVITDCTKL